jgi:hypothetical protein
LKCVFEWHPESLPPHVLTHHFDSSALCLLAISEENLLVPEELLALPEESCALNLAACT